MLYDLLDAVPSAVRKVVAVLLETIVTGIVAGIRLAEKW